MVQKKTEILSVTILFISSGIVISPDRIPASTRATLTFIFLATIAQAMVELTLLTTKTKVYQNY